MRQSSADIESLLEQLRDIFAKVLSVPRHEVELSSKLNTLREWDSLNHLSLILEIERHFGVKFGGRDLERLLSVEAIVEALAGRRQGRR